MNPKILIDYIKQNGIENLVNKKYIDIKYHSKYPNLIMLKYSQINSDFTDPIVRICRGIILDKDNDWKVINYNYSKFANYGENYADKIDFSVSHFYEKMDGSYIQLYFYDNAWHCATSGTPDGSGKVGDFGFTFAKLFWRVFNELGYKLPTDTSCSYAFELLTPFNMIVVQHKENKIVLHGGRNLQTFREINPIVEAHHLGWECVKTFPLNSIEAALEMTKNMDGTKQEGFVVVDSSKDRYNRVKLKCEHYINLSHLKESCTASKRQMLDIIRKNESSEFLTYFPQFKDMFFEIKIKYERLLGQIEGYLDAIKGISDRKLFASYATTQKFSGILFAVKFGKTASVKSGLAEVQIKTLEDWLGIKTETEKTK